jgi:hypothetical protein
MGKRDKAGLRKACFDGERAHLFQSQFGLGEYRIG